ncbi:hypothetical protein [Trueperella pyogenes]|uniref:hypothetical protein n=1 Tax=Trueperella pyogenes TaxID=1661 RepID=UPI00324EDA2E
MIGTILSPKTRSWLYGISLALIPLLVAGGAIAQGKEQMILNLIAAVLGMGNAGVATAYRPTRGADGCEDYVS